MRFPLKVAYVLGWRHLSFSASVTVLDGTVSSTWYDIEPDVLLGFPLSYFVEPGACTDFPGIKAVVPCRCAVPTTKAPITVSALWRANSPSLLERTAQSDLLTPRTRHAA